MTFCVTLKFSLHVATFSPVLCPVNSTYLGVPKWSAPSWQLKESAVLCLSSSCLHRAWTSCQGVHLWHSSSHLICLPSLRNHCYVSPVIQWLKKTWFCILCLWFGWIAMKLIMAPIIPSFPEAKSQGNYWNSSITRSFPLPDSLFLNFTLTFLLKIFW